MIPISKAVMFFNEDDNGVQRFVDRCRGLWREPTDWPAAGEKCFYVLRYFRGGRRYGAAIFDGSSFTVPGKLRFDMGAVEKWCPVNDWIEKSILH